MFYLSSNVLWWAATGVLIGALATVLLLGRRLWGLLGNLLFGAIGGLLGGLGWHWLAFHTIIADWLVAQGWTWNWFTRKGAFYPWLALGHWWGGVLFAAIGAWLLLFLMCRGGYRKPQPAAIRRAEHSSDWQTETVAGELSDKEFAENDRRAWVVPAAVVAGVAAVGGAYANGATEVNGKVTLPEVDLPNVELPDINTQCIAAKSNGHTSITAPVPQALASSNGQSGAYRNGGSVGHPDNLTMIKGINRVYQRRLYTQGLYTWQQIAETSVETLEHLTSANGANGVTSWPMQAQMLLARYPERMNATYTGPLPDELEGIHGIGFSTQHLLYMGGIYTHEQLAQATLEQISEIIPLQAQNRATNFVSWIEQAAARMPVRV